MTVKEMKRRLVGRKIVGFEANAFRDGRGPIKDDRPRGFLELRASGGRITYDPVLILDDGTRLSFVVRETEGTEYGIDPHLSQPRS